MDKLDFGKELIKVRKARGLTQAEVAEKCNVAIRTIQRIESGVVKPRSSTIKIISKSLEIDFFKNSKLKNHDVLLHLKNLLNFKKNAIKKISILSFSILFIVFVYATTFNIKSKFNTSKKEKKIKLSTKDKNYSLSEEYDFIGNFGEIGKDFAVVKKDNKYGLMNADGEIKTPAIFDSIRKFGEIGKDFAVVKKNNKYGLLNLDGQVVIPCKYENIKINGRTVIATKNGRNLKLLLNIL